MFDATNILRRSRINAAIVGVTLGSLSAALSANPLSPVVVNGEVSFAQPNAATLEITNSHGSIIDWGSFSIGAGETTRFIQADALSAVLNRVTGADPSAILGNLLSNGRVFLINPNGIVFGAGAVVDTAGLIASTLDMRNEDFLSGRYAFVGDESSGSIVNQGIITSAPGGEVVLIAPSIENSGIIHTPAGELVLAAGREVTFTSLALEGVTFEVQAPEDEVLNLGALIAERGAVGAFAGTLTHSGVAEAQTIEIAANGDIVLGAGSTTLANGAEGGAISVASATGTTWVSGTVEASGTTGSGGRIELLGEQVGLIDEAVVDASGRTGGGEVLIGGDYKGGNGVQRAAGTFVGENARIAADATASGDGGRVIVWADGATRMHGEISARGGANGGDGGFVETSGEVYLDVTTTPDVSAPNGAGGEWLLDPFNITIQVGTGTLDGLTPNFVADADDSTIDVAVINAALDADNTVIIDTNTGVGGQVGDVVVNADLTKSAGAFGQLIFDVDNDLTINNAITAASGGIDVTFNVGNNANINANIDTGDGSLSFDNGAFTLNGVATASDEVRIGFAAADVASVTVDGGTWDVIDGGNAIVGFDGQGTLTLQNGAALTLADGGVFVGDGAGASGSLNVLGGSVLDVSSDEFDNVVVGFLPGSTGTLVVDGAGSTVVTRGTDNTVQIGFEGNGDLTVSNGAVINTLQFEVARFGSGTATITDAGSTIIAANDNGNFFGAFANEAGFVRIAREDGADGTLNVFNGGRLEIRETTTESGPGLQIARHIGSLGRVFIDGAGSSIDISQNSPVDPNPEIGPAFLQIGRRGEGHMTISNGGQLNVNAEEAVVQVSRGGADSRDPNPDPVQVQSTVTINSGGRFVIDGTDAGMTIGRSFDGDGLVTVTGSGSELAVDGFDSYITVANDGVGELRVENGASVDPVFLTVARNAGSRGTLSVDGTGSRVVVSGAGTFEGGPQAAFLTIGRGGEGDATVTNGGAIEIIGDANPNTGFQLGRDAGSTGTLLVDGDGSRVSVTSDVSGPGEEAAIVVGNRGSGSMTVRNGGQVVHDESGVSTVALAPNSVGVAVVDGASSSWGAGASLLLGLEYDYDTGQITGPGGSANVQQSGGGTITADTVQTSTSSVQEASSSTTDDVLATLQQAGESNEDPFDTEEEEEEDEDDGGTVALTEEGDDEGDRVILECR